MKKILLSLVTGLFLLSTGCTLAPRYHRPDAPIPNVYSQGSASNSTIDASVSRQEFFKDPGIRKVVDTALANNRDLRIAMLNVEKTRAQYRIQRADLLPTVNAAGSSSSVYAPSATTMSTTSITRQYSATLGFSSFELDLFGRIRSLTDSALETYYSIENDAQTARLTLVSEVVGIYLQLIADRELRDLTEQTYTNRKDHFQMVKKRYETGVVSQLELNQARTVMEEARVSLVNYDTQLGKDTNALILLMGAPLPSDLPEIRKLSQVQKLPDVKEGIPSLLIERRPDIVSAEHMLKATNANIGAARANFFPNISLTGALGTLSFDFARLFESGAGTWNFGPTAVLPIFDTGRNISRLNVAQRDRDISVATYEKAIQTAFREVADALVQRNNIGELIAAQSSLLDATKQTFSLAEARYAEGVDSQLTLLDAQRSLFEAEQGFINTLLLRETNALTLYKTLGGGWK